jgi:hypothetical protein
MIARADIWCVGLLYIDETARFRTERTQPMKTMTTVAVCMIVCGLLAATKTTHAADPHPLLPAERGAMARAYVLKWGNYVERVYRIPVSTWANRMVPTFTHARPENFREAISRNTFESASAALSGRGQRLSDQQVLAGLARVSDGGSHSNSELAAKALGSYTSDLTYTPLQPCRIVDTRVAGGAIGANQSRAFNALVAQGGNFTAQGGMGHDCQSLTSSEAAAVVINITAVGPSTAGYATAYPYGFARPATSSLNYTAGTIVNNTVITRIPSPINSKDFTLYSFAAADYVVDIVGYFAPPVSTELDITTRAAQAVISANSEGYVRYAECPVGYARTGGDCWGALFLPNTYLKETGPAQCVFFNGSSQAESFTAQTRCAKVPGR